MKTRKTLRKYKLKYVNKRKAHFGKKVDLKKKPTKIKPTDYLVCFVPFFFSLFAAF